MQRTNQVSIRQPLVLYATVFMMLTAFVVLTLASFSMVRASKRAYRRAVDEQVRALVHERSLPQLRRLVQGRGESEIKLHVITMNSTPDGISLGRARQAALHNKSAALVSVAIPEPGQEAYLVATLSSSVPTSIAFVEISQLVPFVMLGALACAAVLAFFFARLLLPSLKALAEVAEDPRALPLTGGLEQSGAPTEIHEVARRFRQTVRLLNDERAMVEAQRDELERMQQGLIRASKLASVGRLAAGIAHEVGNPLAAVKGYLSIMRSGLEEPQRSEVLVRSVKELDRIHKTIQQLLTYARHGESSQEPPRTFELREAIDDALTLVHGHPDLRNVTIEDEVGPEPALVSGHPGRVNQVLVNLVLNAAQAMREVPSPQISLRLDRTQDDLVLEMRDNGPGIPEAQAEAIFDPFFTTKDPGEGTGLGLAVSRALMEAMGGDLRLHHSSSEGTTFQVRLRPAPTEIQPS